MACIYGTPPGANPGALLRACALARAGHYLGCKFRIFECVWSFGALVRRALFYDGVRHLFVLSFG